MPVRKLERILALIRNLIIVCIAFWLASGNSGW